MTHLLDANVLLAGIWATHPSHEAAVAWLEGKQLAVCPLTELGFIRISTQPKVFNAPMEQARKLLAAFLKERGCQRLDDDLPALDSQPKISSQVTDSYLADLAKKHGCKLATMDAGLQHPAAVLVA